MSARDAPHRKLMHRAQGTFLVHAELLDLVPEQELIDALVVFMKHRYSAENLCSGIVVLPCSLRRSVVLA